MNLQMSNSSRTSAPRQTTPVAAQQTRSQSRQRLLRRARDIRQQARSAADLWLAEQYEAAAELL